MTSRVLFAITSMALLVTSAFSLKLRVTPLLPSLPQIPLPEGPVTAVSGDTLPPLDTTYYFDQLIDHNNPSLGTFKQRYWHTWEFYQPGGPIVLTTPGETNADGLYPYLTNQTIIGQIAQQEHGATVLIEHRFFGQSNPYPDLTEQSLHVLTVQQSIEDLAYFAKNVQLPMPGGNNVKPDSTPWILVGASYAGALTAWTLNNKPGVFAAGYGSSAVVETITDFWQFFEPIRQNMPANCSADIQAVIAHFDQTFKGTNTTAISDLKASFGMADLTHLDDVVTALKNPLDLWQSLSPADDSNPSFWQFCDFLETKDGVVAPAGGWGLDHALATWSYYMTLFIPAYCGGVDVVECLGSYDPSQSLYTSTTVDNPTRSWDWLACNELGWFQDSAPVGHPTLVSRIVTPAYRERQCSLMFPKTFPSPPNVKAEKTSKKYGGWDISVNHLFFANGRRDPWREATMSASSQHIKSTSEQVIAISDGFHASDIATYYGDADPTVKAVQVQALQSMARWLPEWRSQHNIKSRWPGQGVSKHLKSSPKWGRGIAVEAE